MLLLPLRSLSWEGNEDSGSAIADGLYVRERAFSLFFSFPFFFFLCATSFSLFFYVGWALINLIYCASGPLTESGRGWRGECLGLRYVMRSARSGSNCSSKESWRVRWSGEVSAGCSQVAMEVARDGAIGYGGL
jgi:hypothetical protein